jgi:hypothetical protein
MKIKSARLTLAAAAAFAFAPFAVLSAVPALTPTVHADPCAAYSLPSDVSTCHNCLNGARSAACAGFNTNPGGPPANQAPPQSVVPTPWQQQPRSPLGCPNLAPSC